MIKTDIVEELFDQIIEGERYVIYKFRVGDIVCTAINSSINVYAPSADEISYNEETKTFNVVDYIMVGESKVKVMYNLDLNLHIVGLIYNDGNSEYDEAPTLKNEDEQNDTTAVYERYKATLIAKLTSKNNKSLSLINNKEDQQN